MTSHTTKNGKGSRRRPTNAEKYNTNYDRIFCKKGTQPQTEVIEKMDILNSYRIVDLSDGHEWRPACGGLEKPFTWGDKEYLYMYNHATGEHAYYNATDDVFEPSVEFN